MYLVLNEKLNVDEEYSFATYQKRFFNNTIEELSNGASAYKNYVLGDVLYFYNVKDTLDIKNLDNGEQLFKFKVFEEIPYRDVVGENKSSYLRIFKFAENIESIATSNKRDEFLDELLESFDFLNLLDLYSFMINKNKEMIKDNLDSLISRYELGMINKSYEYKYPAILDFSKLIKKQSINKAKLVDRFKSIIINERCVSQEYMMFLDDILYIEDLQMLLELLEVWLKNSVSIILLEQDREMRKNIYDAVKDIEESLDEKVGQNNNVNKDDVMYIKTLIKEIKTIC